MDSLTFHLNAHEADTNLLNSIKAYYGNRRIQITVKPDASTPDELNDEADDQDYALPYEDIARIARSLERGEPIDLVTEMQKLMAAK